MLTFPFFFTHLNISENLDIHSKNQVPPKYLQSMPTASFKKFFRCVFCVRKNAHFTHHMCQNRGLQNTCRMVLEMYNFA